MTDLTLWNILQQCRMYPEQYEMFFDLDGTTVRVLNPYHRSNPINLILEGLNDL